MSSQVVTFYEDEAKTNALYPRTKLSAISDDDGKALSETISELNIKTRVNYLRPTLQTTTRGGITCTDNGDGTYTLNGTSGELVNFYFVPDNSYFPLKKGKYKFICSPDGSDLVKEDGVHFVFEVGDLYLEEQTSNIIELSEDIKTVTYCLFQVRKAGITLNNFTIKPMITDDLSATYDDFVSYDNSLVTGSSQYFFGGIDTNRVLASNVTEYTATEDCWVKCQIGNPFGYGTLIYIDDVEVSINYIGGGFTNLCSFNRWFPLVNGQTVKIKCASSSVTLQGYINIYGIAR